MQEMDLRVGSPLMFLTARKGCTACHLRRCSLGTFEVTRNRRYLHTCGHQSPLHTAAYHLLGEHQRAVEDLDEAIRLDPKYADNYYNRGNAYGKLGEHQRAIQDYERAIQLGADRGPLESAIEEAKSQR